MSLQVVDRGDRLRADPTSRRQRTVEGNRPSPVQRQELNMSVGYSAAYWWGMTPWTRAGRRSRASFDVLLDREEGERGQHLGRALDLGCGTGERTGHLVERGWDAVGIDNVRQAVDIAVRRTGVADTRFVIGDVRHLVHSGVGTGFSLVLDVGCFEGLGDDDRALVAAGVTRLAAPDATVLLMTTSRQRSPVRSRGASQEDVERAYAGWTVVSVEPADPSGMSRAHRLSAPTWYRLRRG
jgi:cyclopropane fatty-acyl-phospholipid synthase-like methyltransferase